MDAEVAAQHERNMFADRKDRAGGSASLVCVLRCPLSLVCVLRCLRPQGCALGGGFVQSPVGADV